MIKSILLTLCSIIGSFMIVTGQSEMEKKVIETEVRKPDSLHAAAGIRNATVTCSSFQRICEAVRIQEAFS